MFDSIIVRRQAISPKEHPIDLGMLFETMLFYGSTKLIADLGTFDYALRSLGTNALIALVTEGFLEVYVTESMTGIHTVNAPSGNMLVEVHSPVIFSSPRLSLPIDLRRICSELTGASGKGRRLALRIEPLIHVIKHDNSVLDGARATILNRDNFERAARIVVANLIPGVQTAGFRFESNETTAGITISTNVSFEALNRAYHTFVSPEHSTISPALILSHIVDAESDMYFGSHHVAEVATSQLGGSLIAEKISYITSRRNQSDATIGQFQEALLKDARAFREAINSQSLSLSEAMSVLRHSSKFRSWLRGVPFGGDLLREYFEAVASDSLLDKLPAKTIRWSIFTSLGLIADAVGAAGVGTTIGLGLSALDAFVLDKLLRGWKPNQFIEKHLLPAVAAAEANSEEKPGE